MVNKEQKKCMYDGLGLLHVPNCRWSTGLAFGVRSDCLPPAQSNLLPLTQLKTGVSKGYDWLVWP